MTIVLTASPTGRHKSKFLLCWVVWLVTTVASGHAPADVGVQLGPHAGVALSDDVDPYVGFGLRLTAPSSPLTLQPTFDYVFDENQTLYHVGGNVLYELPTGFRLKPYLGVGASFSAFTLNEESMTADSEGYRLGMNLLAGARLELPWVSPFFQVTKRVGELDAFAVGGGVELTLRDRAGAASAPEPMRFAVTPYLANNVVGDVQPGRVGLGMSLAFFPWEHWGFELDGQVHGHFFRDDEGDFEEMDRATALQRILEQEPLFEPGLDTSYSNSGYTLLAILIEEVAGKPYPDFVRERIFEPLGMERSGLYGEARWQDGNVAIGRGAADHQGNDPSRWPAPTWALLGNGGLVSTLSDLLELAKALTVDGLFQPSTLQELRAVTEHQAAASIGEGSVTGYAGGNDFGFNALVLQVPEDRAYVLAASHVLSPITAEILGVELLQVLYGEPLAVTSP